MSRATDTARKRFDLSARLPDQVFRGPAELGFLFADSALLTAAEGWEILRTCAHQFGDAEIFAVIVDDLVEVRRVTKPCLEIDPTSPRELLLNWLDQEEDGTHSPLYVDARVLAFGGTSGKWGLWIDQDRELAVLGAPAHSLAVISAATRPAFLWLPARNVFDLLEPSFHPDPVPSELLERLQGAYHSTSSTETSS